ncbi:MAG: S8 family serine peptidase [Thermoleophilia bacterium]
MTRRESRPVRLPRPVRLGVCAAVLCGTVLAGTATGQQAPDPLVTSGAESWLARVVPANLTPPSSIPPIAIIETGFDSTHPEMQGGWITQRRPSPQPDPTNAAAVSDYADRIDHGTAVASIIGAPRNGVGMEGVLPGATVWVYGNSDSCPDVAAAVRQAARDGARVIDLSLGFLTKAGVHPAVRRRDVGVGKNALVVAAAGNPQVRVQPLDTAFDRLACLHGGRGECAGPDDIVLAAGQRSRSTSRPRVRVS